MDTSLLFCSLIFIYIYIPLHEKNKAKSIKHNFPLLTFLPLLSNLKSAATDNCLHPVQGHPRLAPNNPEGYGAAITVFEL